MKVSSLSLSQVFSKYTLSRQIVRSFLFLVIPLLILSSLLAACDNEDGAQSEAAAPADPMASQGQTVFQQNCASCHSLNEGTVIVGPSLAGIAGRAGSRVEGQSAQDYIQLSILRPGEYVVEGFTDLMPTTFGTTLSGEELDALIAYLLTLE